MNLQTPPGLDLTACEREPIHIPGSIQPHGVLLAVRLSDRAVTYASANAAEAFGLDQAILELEEVPPDAVSSLDALYPTLRRFVEQLQSASTVEVLCSLAAQDIR